MRRWVVVVLPLLVVPLIALSVLAWSLAGRAEDRLLAAQRKQHEDLVAAFDARFTKRLARLGGDLRRWAEGLGAGSLAAPPPGRGQSWTVVFDEQGRWWYPASHAVHLFVETDPYPGREPAMQQLAEAEAQERSGRDADLAVDRYKALDRASVPPRIRAKALLGLARCTRKAGDPQGASGVYRRLMDQFDWVVDETGMNPGAEAGAALVASSIGAEAADSDRAAWRTHVDALLSGRYPMSWALMLGHLTNALALVPQDVEQPEDVQRRAKLQRAVRRLQEMSAATSVAKARQRSGGPRLQTLEQRVLLVEPVSLSRARGWAIAAFSIDWAKGELVGPLIAELGGADRGVAFVRDSLHRTIVGPAIGPEATSTEISLSRWGLPWTMGVGFADLAGLRAQAMRRDVLLTGSIVVLVVLMVAGVLIAGRMVRREMELSELKSQFVDNVSHELRTPMTSIKLFSEMLHGGQVHDPERQREYYRLLASESDRLGRMVENMLNFSRIVAGRMRLKPEPTDMAEYLAGLQRQLSIQARPTGHRVHLHLGSDLPTCDIDRDAMSRAIANLVSNAVKYSPDEREVVVTAQRRDQKLSITVRDKGMGIPPADLPHVFERFYRVRNPDGNHVQGTGLGLTIVNPFVERLIGSIRRECLDHVIVFNEAHLIRILTAYFEYYHESRTHLSLARNAPKPRQVERPEVRKIVAIPQVGGLHHRYARAALMKLVTLRTVPCVGYPLQLRGQPQTSSFRVVCDVE